MKGKFLGKHAEFGDINRDRFSERHNIGQFQTDNMGSKLLKNIGFFKDMVADQEKFSQRMSSALNKEVTL